MSDILTKVSELLEESWKPANTNNKSPTIKNMFDVKRIGLAKDVILLKEILRRPSDNATGAQSKKTETLIVLDVRTVYSREHLILMINEIERIFNNNQVDVFSDGEYDIQDIENIQDLSDQTVKLFRKTMDVRLKQLNVVIS